MNLFGCTHEHIGWPQSGWQKCTDCGARRRYRRLGTKPGPWITEPEIVRNDGSEEAEGGANKSAVDIC